MFTSANKFSSIGSRGNRKTWVGFGLAFVLAALFAVTTMHAQVNQGTISGTVTDQTGAVVVGAQVQVIDETTHFVSNATTNATGLYSVVFLTPDTYDVKVVAKGFTPAEQTGAVLIAGGVKAVDFKLSVGSDTQSVTVTSNGEMLETQTASITTTLDSTLIESTPNLSDNPFYLGARTPGIYGNFTQGSEMTNDTPTSNGAIAAANGLSGRAFAAIDGILDLANAGAPGNGNPAITPPPYTTQELSVKTSEYDAQYGHSNGGVYDDILKSGGQQYHGDAYIVWGNERFDANTWQRNNCGNTITGCAGTATPNGLPRAAVDWVQPGFEVSGPLRIPKLYHGRDKTYFMVGFQHQFNLQAPTATTAIIFNVPTVKERLGDFSELVAAGGVIYDPTTTVPQGASSTYAPWCSGSCTPGERESFTQEYNEGPTNSGLCGGDVNCIPKSRWNSTGAILAGAAPLGGFSQGIYPVPNVNTSTSSTPYVGNYLPANYDTVQYFHSIVARVDHEFDENNKTNVTFLRNVLNNVANDNAGFPDNEIGSAWVPTVSSWTGGIIDFTRVISSTAMLDAKTGGMYHPNHVYRSGMPYFNLGNLNMSASLPASLQNFPGTSPSGVASQAYTGLGAGTGANDFASYWDSTVIFNKTLARMNIKMGGEFLKERDDGQFSTSTPGTFSSSTAFTQNDINSSPSKTNGYGDGIASLLLGYASGATATINPQPALGWEYYAVFLQDDWRVTNNLTLNLGLRYDYDSVVTERHNQMNAGFAFGTPNPMNQGTLTPPAPTTVTVGSVTSSAPQGYYGGLTFVGPGNRFPFSRELKDRLQPRFGAAYRLSSRDVLRGGFSIMFTDNPLEQSTIGFSATTTFNPSNNANYTPSTCTAAQGGDAYGFCTLTNPYPNGVVLPTGSSLGLSTGVGGAISTNDQHRVYPMVKSYSIGLEHQFPGQVMVNLYYSGSYSSGIGVGKNYNALPACYYAGGSCAGAGITSILNGSVPNPMAGYLPKSSSLNNATVTQQLLDVPYPEFGSITVTNSILANNHRIGVLNYNAGMATLTKRMNHGLEFNVAITWAKIMDQLSYTNQIDAFPAKYEDQQPSRFLVYNIVYNIPTVPVDNAIVRHVTEGWRFTASENWQQATGMGPPSGAFSTGVSPKAIHQTQQHWFNNCYIPVVSQATATTPVVYGSPTSTSPATGAVVPGCQNGEQPAWIQQPSFTLNQLNSSTVMGNIIRFPEGVYVNAGFGRTFPLHERLSLMLRADCQNVVNNVVHIGSFGSSLGGANFGTDTAIGQNNDPRFFRFRAILSF